MKRKMKIQSPRKSLAFALTLAMAFTTAFGGFGFVGIDGAVEDVYAGVGSAAQIGATTFGSITLALAAAVDGNIITLQRDVTESAICVASGRAITIDGTGYTITGVGGTSSAALTLSGTGTITLKNITLQGGTADDHASEGLEVSGSVNVQSIGTVNCYGGRAPNGYKIGVWNKSTGTVNVTNATGNTSGDATGDNSYGVWNNGSGTVNVINATGGTNNTPSFGVYNTSTGTVNVFEATGGTVNLSNVSCGVNNKSTGTVNVTNSIGGSASTSPSGCSYGVTNASGGAVNVTKSTGGSASAGNSYGVQNYGAGIVNVISSSGINGGIGTNAGTVSTPPAVTTLTLNKRADEYCVLESITIALSGPTTVGTLPQVSKDGVVGYWYTDSSKTTTFTAITVNGTPGGINLYSSFYGTTIPVPGAPTAVSAIAGDTQATVSFSAPAPNGGSTITGYTVTSTPDGLTGAGLTSPIIITGLTNGTAYTFTVTAKNSVGIGAASSASNSVTPTTTSGGGGGGSTSHTGSTTINTNTGSVTGTQMINAASAGTNGGTVTINSNRTSDVTFPTSGLDSLKGKDNSLTVVTEKGTLTFDSKAVNAMGSQASGEEIEVIVADADKTKLTDEQLGKVADKTVYDLTVMSGGKLISSFNGGKVNVSIPYVLKAGETADNVTVWYLADDGSLTEITCVYDAKTKSVTFVVDHFSKYVIGASWAAGWVNPFADVKSTDWYYDAAAYVNKNGFMNGQTTTTFDGEGAMTRGMFVTILGRMEGINTSTYASQKTFSDVKDTQYYTPYINWASEKNIVNGIGGDKFAPEQAVTREQMAVMMTNYMKFKNKGPVGLWAIQLHYSDLDKISSWTGDAVMFVTLKSLMTGIGNDANGNPLFAPNFNASRAQTAQVIMRLGELLK